MEIFEIHITGSKNILQAGKELGVNTIVIELMKPDETHFRTEYMTSQVHRCENYKECKSYVDDLVAKLQDSGVEIVRVKIECPGYLRYKDKSLYAEIHFEPTQQSALLPLSHNKDKDYCLCTAREYDPAKYETLWQKAGDLPERFEHWTMELCLYDTNVNEDKDWFDLYEDAIR